MVISLDLNGSGSPPQLNGGVHRAVNGNSDIHANLNGNSKGVVNGHADGITNGYTNSAVNGNTNQVSSGNGSSPKRSDVPIAIVGMSCRFPGDATSPEKLWQLCANAKSAWSEVPSERWNKNAFYHPDGGRIGTVSISSFILVWHTDTRKTNVRGGHFLSQDIALFDAPFFNVSAEEAKVSLPTMFQSAGRAGINNRIRLWTLNYDCSSRLATRHWKMVTDPCFW
jgi:hypothetical protein